MASPPRLRNTRAKAVEPSKIAITMAVTRRVSSQTLARLVRLKPPSMAASTMAPTAPKAPASVGVAMPKKMLPNTKKISAKGGSSTRSN